MARTLLKYSVNSGDPGDILVRVGAAPDAIVADQAKSDGPINGLINKRVLQFVRELHLPPHPVADFTYGTDYFEAKSKGPFRWCAAEKGARGCAPWVSFLGNQVRFDGAVRVRKDTVRKHVLKIKEEVGSAIGVWERLGGKLRAGVKKALFYKSLRRRLIAKGVGYLRAGPVPKDGICWAAAFPNLTKNAVCARQMRTLDFVRERALGAVRRVLALKGMRYLGRPSSYYGYLKKVKRPAQGRRRVMKLPYSEL